MLTLCLKIGVMNLRTKYLLSTVVGLCLLPGFSLKSQDKPNILWITIEDTSPQFVGCYGNPWVKTPTIDSLAKKGIRFTSAFATGPVCSSSRSSIITGLPTEILGTGHHRSQYNIPDEIKGFPYYLRKAGYYTSNNKKTDYNIGNVKRFINEAWDDCSGEAGWWNRKGNQPFFSVFNFLSSHQSRTMTNPWLWYEKNVLHKLNTEEQTTPEEFDMPPFYRDTEQMRRHFSRVYNSINLTDKEISKLLARLESSGLKESTIIFFYADHGEGIPRGKTNPIALGYRVPFIIWFPEKYQHLNPWGSRVVTDELVSFHDLAPTILSIANVDIPDYMTGRPILGSKRTKSDKFIYMSRNRIDETPDLARSVTDGKYIYTRVFLPRYPVLKYQKYGDVSDIVQIIRHDYLKGYLNDVQSKMLEARPVEYLFDIENDSWEINNLANDKNYHKVLKKFHNEMLKRAITIKDVHFLTEKMMVDNAGETTPMEIRQDEAILPIKEVVEMADWVGRGEAYLNEQIKGLSHSSPLIRYWALVGLNMQSKNVLRTYMGKISPLMQDDDVSVAIEAASLLESKFNSEKAVHLLKEKALNDDTDVALMALQKMQYAVNVNQYYDVFNMVIDKWQDLSGRGDVYKVLCCAEVSLHYIDGRILKY